MRILTICAGGLFWYLGTVKLENVFGITLSYVYKQNYIQEKFPKDSVNSYCNIIGLR